MSLGGQWRVIRHYLSNLNAEMEKLLQRVKTSAAAAAHTDNLIWRIEKAVSMRLMHDGKTVEVHKNGAVKTASTEQADAKEASQADERAPEPRAEPRAAGGAEPEAGEDSELSAQGLLAGLRRSTELHFANLRQPSWRAREPLVSKAALQARTAYVVAAVRRAGSEASAARRTADLLAHLAQHPGARQLAVREGALGALLRARARLAGAEAALADEALAALGWPGPPRGRRPAVLALDGGGVRGLLALQALRALERAAGRPARELFDLIAGVSTGAIIAAALAAGAELDAAAELYRRLSRDTFAGQSRLGGGARLVWTHAYYDTRAWERLLRAHLGDVTLQACSRAPPRLALVSTVVRGAARAPFVFRTYGGGGRYRGADRGLLWHAVRASAAAPTYFDEFRLDGLVHQDGGIMVNNPAGVALHEARALWGPAGATLVSVGTGRAPPPPRAGPEGTSWRDKFDAILESATDTEGVHRMLADILPPETYFRLNPPLLAPCAMDEVDPDKIQAMMDDGAAYLRRNQHKVERAAARLTQPRSVLQRAADSLRRAATVAGLPPRR